MSDTEITAAARALAGQIAALPPRTPRLMIALAGPPASGKSTLAAALAAELGRAGRPARAVPMDGFHLDDTVLEARGLLSRKGAPETFDVAGFLHAMRRLATEEAVVLPEFDRAREIAIAGRIVIDAGVSVAVIEGNYLAFNAPLWRDLAPLWDFSVFLDVPEPVLKARLIARWRAHGFGETGAIARAEANDLPNARRIRAARTATTLTLTL